MIVKNLIKKLKKMPQDAQVFMADHDHERFQTNGQSPDHVEFIDKSTMNEIENDDDCGCSDCFKNTPDSYVVLRP